MFEVREGTYAELSEWLEPGGLGVASDTNFILFVNRQNKLQALTDGIFATPPIVLTAARACVPGDLLLLGAGAAPTLPLLTEALSSADPLDTPAPAWVGATVRMKNTTAGAINVATGAGASINGAAVGTAYSLAAGAVVSFCLDSSGTNWAVI
jgi:hypothetical protein